MEIQQSNAWGNIDGGENDNTIDYRKCFSVILNFSIF